MHWINICWLVHLSYCVNVLPPTISSDTDWWQHSVIYEIFPLSFKDSNGDGKGDFKGIVEKLDYITDLGVTAIWLTPFAVSPLMTSGGYDITTDTKKDLGTIDDFKDLVYNIHKKNLKLIMDFVPNHPSDPQFWFKNSTNNNDTYAKYYIWKDAKNQVDVLKNNGITPEPPNNWKRIFSNGTDTSAWIWHPIRKQFYFTQFTPNLPDLNYRNKDLQNEIKDILRLLFDLGVDGFRIDALKHVYESEDLKDPYTADQEEIYDFLDQLANLTAEFKKRDNNTRIIMTESYNSTSVLVKYYDHGIQIRTNFQLKGVTERPPPYTVNDYDRTLRDWITKMPKGAVFQNHDWPRVSTTFGAQLVDGINAFSLFLPGVAIIYYGQELGMDDLPTIDDYSRSPMQWDNTKYAGFTNANNTNGPWLRIHQNYKTRNVQSENSDPNSYLNFYKSLMKLRQTETLKRGGLDTFVFNDTVYVLNRFLPGFNNYTLVINMDTNYTKSVRLSDQIKDLQKNLIVVMKSRNSNYWPEQLISVTESLILSPGATIILTENTLTTTSNTTSSTTPSTLSSSTNLPSSATQLCTSFVVLLLCLQFLI